MPSAGGEPAAVNRAKLVFYMGSPTLAGYFSAEAVAELQARGVEVLTRLGAEEDEGIQDVADVLAEGDGSRGSVDDRYCFKRQAAPVEGASKHCRCLLYLKQYSEEEMLAAIPGDEVKGASFHAGWSVSSFILTFPRYIDAEQVLWCSNTSSLGGTLEEAGIVTREAKESLVAYSSKAAEAAEGAGEAGAAVP